MSKKLIFYQVDNGASVLATLDDETHLLFDIKQKPDDSKDEDKTENIHASLLKTLPKRGGRRYLSVFALTHPDLDHCQGFSRVFYYPEQNEDDSELIEMDELWVTAEIFNEKLSGPAKEVQKEARRRLRLWSDKDKQVDAERPGNMIVVFGRSDTEDLRHLPKNRHLGAGMITKFIAGQMRSDFEAFVHCPFSYLLDNDEELRNDTSLILQMKMTDGNSEALMLIGGDAGCKIWKTVYNKSHEKGNKVHLEWDVFFVPHHGSYKFFTEMEHEEGRKEAEKNPARTSMTILEAGREYGWLVCSSRPVRENNYDDKDPPHIEAIKHYRKRATDLGDKEHFVCLMENPSESDTNPLVLRLTSRGLQKLILGAASISVGSKATSQPSRWG
ncbi:conserved hypothetical protein [uncultured Desulfobacterium sp.]|uniref:Metallohydrolase n=1 Tax=uncultured Desulfobacterium sp. TaxID=201089 RepID=A0A445MXS0_9BACT|nr:conserved hypothetical protein [uncultured Desulfobacterium sp.]